MLRQKIMIGAAILLLAAVLAAVSRSSPYSPGLAPAPGYRLWNATQPRGLLAAYGKSIQQLLDIRDCQYEILGWSSDGVLYFQGGCGGQSLPWRTVPDQPASVLPVAAAPPGLYREPVLKAILLDRVRAPGVWPVNAEPYTRDVIVQSMPYTSPDGRWLAFVAERVYGPQDVLLLTEAP